MKNQRSHLYEGMYILSAVLSEDAKERVLEKIKGSITEKGGEIHKVMDQGRKRMAYPIGKRRDGHYFLFYFSAPTKSVEEMWREYRLNEDVVRFMTVRAEAVPEKIEFQPLPE
ncbi:MAG: 30S ribosomal protein S6 [Verrucomicrobia bacterium]|nr:30S ribosomal protein S6 [Verrucomicrobiota bacterium]